MAAGAGGKVILVVEDDADILYVLELILINAGYRVRKASTRTDGLALLAQGGIDLVIADSVLQGGNGDAIAAAIALPVILMSGYPDRIERLRGGEVPFIAKPFRAGDLLPLIARLLQ